MTLATKIYLPAVSSPTVFFNEVVEAVIRLAGEDTQIADVAVDRSTYYTETIPGQGLPAWVKIRTNPKGLTGLPAGLEDAQVEITLDTAYGFTFPVPGMSTEGGCGLLHALVIHFVAEKHPDLAWVNEFTGELRFGTDHTHELTRHEDQAETDAIYACVHTQAYEVAS